MRRMSGEVTRRATSFCSECLNFDETKTKVGAKSEAVESRAGKSPAAAAALLQDGDLS